MRGLLVALPCALADDTSSLLSLRNKMTLDSDSRSSVEAFLQVAEGRNVTQMEAMMQNLVETQLYGDGVTEVNGDRELDPDIGKALQTIKELLLGDIQNALKHEHGLDQASVNKLHKCWDSCKEASSCDQQQVDEFWGLMQSSKSQHETCREDVHAKYVDKVTKCNDLDTWIKSLKCPSCVKEECVVIHDPTSRNVGDSLQDHIAWATSSYSEWQLKHAACSQAVIAHEEADIACDKTQAEFESNTCAHRQAVWTACNVNQMTCCKQCALEFNAEVSRVECAEKDRKIDWSATKKIECYIDVLMKSPTDEQLKASCDDSGKACINRWRESMYKDCDKVCVDIDYDGDGEYREINGINTTHRTTTSHGDRCTLHLDIDFPIMPHCVKCPPPIPGPCEFGFISTYYATFDDGSAVSELDGENECTPDTHTHRWAYSRAECNPCSALIGISPDDTSCFYANQVMIADKGHAAGYLNIGEVIVNDGAKMSVTLSDSWSAPHLKDNCVDGNPDTFCHSKHTKNWWVTFTLEEPTCINNIKMINRKDCCSDRIVGADLTILNQGTKIWTDRVESLQSQYEWTLGAIKDNCEGWSKPERKWIDGTCFVGAFGPVGTVSKTFRGLSSGCSYKMKGIMDSWASIDSEPYTISINGKDTTYQTRGAANCNENGWQSHDYGFGRKLGSGGSGRHGWKDCYKPFEIEFNAPADGTVTVDMKLAINQHINDEAWGFHDIEFEIVKCGIVVDDGAGWSVGTKHVVDGTTYLGAFTQGHRPKKTFSGLDSGCTYRLDAIMDTYASTDRERFEFSVNGEKTTWGSNTMRHAGGCDNGWSEYPHGFGLKVGSPGSHHGSWKDCWKPFSTEFTAPFNGQADVEFHIAVDQALSDEGWGFHDVIISKVSCPVIPPPIDNFPREGPCAEVPEMTHYELVESIPTPKRNADWDTRSHVPFALKKDTSSIKRVAYCMKMDDKYAWASFDHTDANKIGIPVDYHLAQAVSNMNVVSNHPDVTAGSGVSGSVEFWDHCYGQGAHGIYDHDDALGGANCYGSMQVHANQKTVLAFNGWSHGGHCDLQLGNAANHHNSRDGTFNQNCEAYLGKAEVLTYVLHN